MRITWTLALALALAAAPRAAHGGAAARVELDVLFVIDNSGSMGEEQTALATHIDRFFDELALLPGGLPSLHVGIVSSNVGIAPFQSTGCFGEGDDGRLQNAARGACTPPNGYFLVDEIAADGTRLTNYFGSRAEAFTCVARLGISGCGLEQHFESMKRALDGHNPENAGFLRDDAFLAVVFLADEDDCSARDPTMFDPSQTGLDDPLGPFGSFRCTELGVLCDGAPIARTPATYSMCEPRVDSYAALPSTYVEFLRSIKRDPSRVIVAAIVGPPAPFAVGSDPSGNPQLLPSCGSSGIANPGVRFRALLDELPGSTFTSICDLAEGPTPGDEVARIGAGIRAAIENAPDLPDAGLPVPDSGSPVQGDGERGCGCRASPRDTGGTGAVLALVLVRVLVSRRLGRARGQR